MNIGNYPRGAGKMARMIRNCIELISEGKKIGIFWEDGTMSFPRTIIGVKRCCKKRSGRKMKKPKPFKIDISYFDELVTERSISKGLGPSKFSNIILGKFPSLNEED